MVFQWSPHAASDIRCFTRLAVARLGAGPLRPGRRRPGPWTGAQKTAEVDSVIADQNQVWEQGPRLINSVELLASVLLWHCPTLLCGSQFGSRSRVETELSDGTPLVH